MAARKKTTKPTAVKKEVVVPEATEEVIEQEVELKLPCSATDCDSLPPNLVTRAKVTVYEIAVSPTKWRYGLTTWGQKPTNKLITTGRTAARILQDIKNKQEPIGTLESFDRITL